jgi:hypothetical protein
MGTPLGSSSQICPLPLLKLLLTGSNLKRDALNNETTITGHEENDFHSGMHEMGFQLTQKNVGTHKNEMGRWETTLGSQSVFRKTSLDIRGQKRPPYSPQIVALLSQATAYAKTNSRAWRNAGFG